MYQLASPVTEWGAPGAYTRSRLFDSKVALMLSPIIAITHSGSKAIIAVPRAYRGSLLGCDDVFHLRCILFFLPYSNNRRARDVFPPLRLLSFLAPARGRKRGNPATLNTISNYVASNQIYGQHRGGRSLWFYGRPASCLSVKQWCCLSEGKGREFAL